MRHLLSAFSLLALILSPLGVLAEELSAECKLRFVQCVQQTGSPLEGHSVAAACSTEMVVDQNTLGLSERVEIEPREGQAFARLHVTNVSGEPTTTANRAWGVSCPDGSRETLYFLFNNVTIAPQSTITSHSVVACFGQASATADPGAAQSAAVQSVETTEFFCNLDQTLSVEATVQGEALVRYQRSDGISGVHKLSASDGSSLFYQACDVTQDSEQSVARQIRDKAKENLIPFMGRVIEGLGLTGPQFDAKYAFTGPRN